MKRIALILACLTALTRGASAMEFHMGEGTNALTIGADVVFAPDGAVQSLHFWEASPWDT